VGALFYSGFRVQIFCSVKKPSCNTLKNVYNYAVNSCVNGSLYIYTVLYILTYSNGTVLQWLLPRIWAGTNHSALYKLKTQVSNLKVRVRTWSLQTLQSTTTFLSYKHLHLIKINCRALWLDECTRRELATLVMNGKVALHCNYYSRMR
jgi:hypothetical protein